MTTIGLNDPGRELAQEEERGWFKVYQSGNMFAGGVGPYADIKRDAAHYAAMYRKDRSVRVRIGRIGARKQAAREPI